MKLNDAFEAIDRIQSLWRRNDMPTLVIPVVGPGRIGGVPCVPIQSIHHGIDWDADKILVTPERPLTALSAVDVKAIHASVAKGQSWHSYQQFKQLKDRIRELEEQVAALKAT